MQQPSPSAGIRFTVIGIADTPTPHLSPEAWRAISHGRVFSGGLRHHQLLAPSLPDDAIWIDITVPLTRVFNTYRSLQDASSAVEVIVFASGDPLFFGFANTIRRLMPEAEIRLFPTFNSLQMLAHRLLLPYHDMRIVSLTGRDWHEFDRALIEGAEKIGVLTDHVHQPSAIARRMMEYGYTEYLMHIGQRMGNPDAEQVLTVRLAAAAEACFSMPNCLIIEGRHQRRQGIPDKEFALLDGRERMITKMPIRLLTLQALQLVRRHVFWDIGFCTGSVSIEARLSHPHLHITAFEIRRECETLMQTNSRRFGAPGIQTVMGDFLNADLTRLAAPDAVFIGGHGGHLDEVIARVATVLQPGGCIVMNAVTPQSRQQFVVSCQRHGLTLSPPLHLTVNDYNPITLLQCESPLS